MPPLDEARNLLVRRWGEMSGYWGINRTMAEIHALLFFSHRPLCTDDIMRQLQVSRGNASMNLRALVDWGLIHRVHQLGDRKEYFQADTDVWHMFETIMRERRRREVEPIITTLDRCIDRVQAAAGTNAGRPGVVAAASPQSDPADEAHATAEFSRRARELRAFLAAMGGLFEFVLEVGAQGIEPLIRSLPGLEGTRAPDRTTGGSPAATRSGGERASRRANRTAPRRRAAGA